ncbi:aspartyl-phosphate phosphatase Spo0E family protein [Fictibacillus sp. UD]|uniref:Spo0E family sporulation regulatory protein-aspartic acid phosphatase n=1 Tax=Fictibacillus sp. UD TaxID=3038777 RepID=UPI0037450BDB
MDEDLSKLLHEIKICRQEMYDLKPSSIDFSNADLVSKSQKLDKLIYLYQKQIMQHIQSEKE